MCTCTRVLCAAIVSMRVWSPIIGEVLELLREEENEHDRFAVCLLKPRAVTVGHVPRELSRKIWHFLKLCYRCVCACHFDLDLKLTHKTVLTLTFRRF